MFSRVVEGADPYRDTEKPFISSPLNGCANITREEQAPPLPRFVRERLFVRSRRIVRTRRRTPHPSAFGCHLPPLGKALVKCEHRLKPKDRAKTLIHCRGRRPRRPVKTNDENKTKRRRTFKRLPPGGSCRGATEGECARARIARSLWSRRLLPPLRGPPSSRRKALGKCEHRLKPRDSAKPLIHCRDRRPRLSTMRTNIWRHTKPHHIL